MNRSITIDILVGITIGIILFVFVAFVITMLPDGLQGQRSVSTALQFILIEVPTIPIRQIAGLFGYSLSEGILFSSSVACYAVVGGIGNLIIQRIKK